MHISLQIIIAALSVMGFYFCLKTIASLIFTSRQIAATVIIESKKQLYDLDLLLSEASTALFATRRKQIAVIVPDDVWNACSEKEKYETKELTKFFGAKLYFTK